MSGRLILAIRDWVQSVVEPFLAWMPSWLVPYVVDAGGIVLLVAMLFGMWRFTVYLWTASFLAPRRLGRRIGAHKKSRNTVARRVRMNTPGVVQKARKTLHSAFAAQAENDQPDFSEQSMEKSVAVAQEIMLSGDPSKIGAQEALWDGNIQAAEYELEEVF